MVPQNRTRLQQCVTCYRLQPKDTLTQVVLLWFRIDYRGPAEDLQFPRKKKKFTFWKTSRVHKDTQRPFKDPISLTREVQIPYFVETEVVSEILPGSTTSVGSEYGGQWETRPLLLCLGHPSSPSGSLRDETEWVFARPSSFSTTIKRTSPSPHPDHVGHRHPPSNYFRSYADSRNIVVLFEKGHIERK